MIDYVLIGVLVTLLMVFLFGLTIFVHELGHFLTARLLGLVVETFSIGFGPPLWKKRINGVVYKIGVIPLGGYVALPQLDPTAMAAVQGERDTGVSLDTAPQARKENSQSDGPDRGEGEADRQHAGQLPPVAPWRKMLVSLSGSIGNIVFAFVLAWVISVSPHATTGGDDTRIGMVETNSPAYAVGLRSGDIIHSVNGQRVSTWSEFLIETHLSTDGAIANLEVHGAMKDDRPAGVREVKVPVGPISEDLRGIVGLYPRLHSVVTDVLPDSPAARSGIQPNDIIETVSGRPVASTRHLIELMADRGERETPVTLRRQNQTLTVLVIPEIDPELGRPVIGVRLGDAASRTPMWMQYRRPWRQIEYDFRQIARILRALVVPTTRGERGQAAGSLGGPLAIMVMLWLSVRASLLNSLGFVRFLNVNLAVLNLLPIPVLDGGHILFSLWEMITRRRVSPRLINILVNLFAILLILAVLLITRNDALRLWRQLRVRETIVVNGNEAEAQAPSADAPNQHDGREGALVP